jgi:hypothetical protein
LEGWSSQIWQLRDQHTAPNAKLRAESGMSLVSLDLDEVDKVRRGVLNG